MKEWWESRPVEEQMSTQSIGLLQLFEGEQHVLFILNVGID
jgi:hypothetical protein